MTGNTNAIPILNHLLNLERLSLANYLQYAQPWVHPADQPLHEAVERIAREELECGRRIAALITRRKGPVALGQSFPNRYTAYSDLNLRYLLDRLVEDQERIIQEVETTCMELRGDAEAASLAAEVLRREQGHLKMLLSFRDAAAAQGASLARAA